MPKEFRKFCKQDKGIKLHEKLYMSQKKPLS